MRLREEHLEWCKARALEYLENGDIQNAITSMLSDMGKHPETHVNPALALLGMMTIQNYDLGEARRFIEGFN